MGRLGFLGKAFGSAAKMFGNALGKMVEQVGVALNNDTIERWGADLRARCQFGATRWNQASSVQKTVDMHKELEKVKISVESRAKTVEAELIEECASKVKIVIDLFLPLVPCTDFRVLSESFAEQIEVELYDKIMEYINPRLSTDDVRCVSVLNIQDDSERMVASKKYQDSVMYDAVNSFKRDCIDVKKRYICKILDLAEAGLKEQEQECRKLERLLTDRVAQNMNENEIDMERERILIGIEKFSILQVVNNQLCVEESSVC